MIERVMDAFEAWQEAKDRLERAETGWDEEFARKQVQETRERVMVAMDRWYEWKRMNGPRTPGK